MTYELDLMDEMLEGYIPGMTSEMDDSLLELLCEDGFLDAEEISGVETPEEQEELIRLAIERGFPDNIWDDESLDAAVKLIVKKLDSLRIWKDLVDEDNHLRAPPAMCAD